MKDSKSSPNPISCDQDEKAFFDAPLRLEKNSIKIGKLEQTATAFGPKREIDFTSSFYRKKDADLLAKEAREAGFEVNEFPPFLGSFTLCATRYMRPTAEGITHWERWFHTKIKNVSNVFVSPGKTKIGAFFKGWTYSEDRLPQFPLEFGRKPSSVHGRTLEQIDAEAIIDRAKVLFGHTPCVFEASSGWCDKINFENNSSAFQLVPSKFLEKARCGRPFHPEPTASAFSQWLYSLYSGAFGGEQNRSDGTTAEKLIFTERRLTYMTPRESAIRSHFPDWELKHNGMSVDDPDGVNYFTVKNLSVRGNPLRVNPDLIYENRQTKEIIIVEIKRSHMHIPTNLWPNIWGQLWCYSQIAEFQKAPKITVVGEVWGDQFNRRRIRHVYLRANVRRNPRAVPYDRFFRSLFDIYRGVDQP